MKLLVIDNYDSFTYNLVHFLGDLGARCVVRRNDEITVDEAMALQPDGIVLSPGPCTPTEAGICCDLIARAGSHHPILGVCLGHQAIGQVYGGHIVRNHPMHGKLSRIRHSGETLFRGINGDFEATRYHSLVIDPATCPAALHVTASTDDGVIMAVSHRDNPVHGVQFHPESILSEHGSAIIRNFLELARDWNARQHIAA
jgi:anthranilate synthase component 2